MDPKPSPPKRVQVYSKWQQCHVIETLSTWLWETLQRWSSCLSLSHLGLQSRVTKPQAHRHTYNKPLHYAPHTHFILSKHRPQKNLKKTLQKQNRYFKGLVEGWGPMVEYLSAISKVLGLMPRTTKALKQNNHATKETSWKGANDSSCCPIL